MASVVTTDPRVAAAVISHVEQHRGALVDLLSELIQLPSVCPRGEYARLPHGCATSSRRAVFGPS